MEEPVAGTPSREFIEDSKEGGEKPKQRSGVARALKSDKGRAREGTITLRHLKGGEKGIHRGSQKQRKFRPKGRKWGKNLFLKKRPLAWPGRVKEGKRGS